MAQTKITAEAIRGMKARGERIAALTAYDFPMTKLLDEAGIPFIHVGDTLGMVVLGYPDTTLVTMADMEHHVRAAARAKPRALPAADLPFGSYDTAESAGAHARRLGSRAGRGRAGKRAPSARDEFSGNSVLRPPRHAAPARPRGRRIQNKRT